jgi:hypothetical protein
MNPTYHQQLVALVFAVWNQLHGNVTSKDASRIADAIASAVEAESAPASGESHAVDAALLAVYAERESDLSEHPTAHSWDAKAGLSKGVWQLRSYLVDGQSLRQQAATWLGSLRAAGLARGIDSSPTRAAHRLAEARGACAAFLGEHEEVLDYVSSDAQREVTGVE